MKKDNLYKAYRDKPYILEPIIVSPTRYTEICKLLGYVEDIRPKYEGGILQYILDDNLFDNKENLGVAFNKACDQLKEFVDE